MVKDENFLARVGHRVREFGKGDVLRVKLRAEKTMTLTGLRTEQIVVQVLEELSPPPVLLARSDAEGVKPKRQSAPPTQRRKQSKKGKTRGGR